MILSSLPYGRAVLIFYLLSVIYIFTMWSLFAYIGGGKHGPKVMFQHILRTGISHDIADLVFPLDATMHMDGGCFSGVLKIAFVMGALGQPFTRNMLTMVILAVFSAVGCSGVPGGDYIVCFLVSRFVEGKNWLGKIISSKTAA